MVKAKPEVIFFDAAGTLLHLRGTVGEHYAAVLRRSGLNADPASLDAAFRAVWRGLPDREPSNGAREGDDRGYWRAIASATLLGAGVREDFIGGERWFEALYRHFAEPGVWALYPEVTGILEELEGSARLAVLSNFDGRLHAVLGHLGIAGRFEEIFISSELGADKPHPLAFQRAAAAMGVDPARCLHVGDEPIADAAGARGAGLLDFLVDRPATDLRSLVASLGRGSG